MDIVNVNATELMSNYNVQNQGKVNSDKGRVATEQSTDKSSRNQNENTLDKQNSDVGVQSLSSLANNRAQVSVKNADNEDNVVVERETLQAAADQIQTFMQSQSRNLAFSVDETTNRSIVIVSDASSGDVIRQIPSEEVLKLAERIQELQQDIGNKVGVLVNQQI